MRGLTLTQPWAQLVAADAKRIETRSWRTHYRGPLAIHAAATLNGLKGEGLPPTFAGLKQLVVPHPFHGPIRQQGFDPLDDEKLRRIPMGFVVAFVDLVDVVPVEDVKRAVYDAARHFHVTGERIGAALPVQPTAEELRFGNYSTNKGPRWAWLLAPYDPRAATRGSGRLPRLREPVRCRGRQGLWNVPASVAERVLEGARA